MKLNQHDLLFTIDLMNLMSQKIAVVSTEEWAADNSTRVEINNAISGVGSR